MDPEPLPYPCVDNHTHLDHIPTPSSPQDNPQPSSCVERIPSPSSCVERSGIAGSQSSPPAPSSNSAPTDPVTTHVERARRTGIAWMVTCGCEVPSLTWTSHITQQHPEILGAIAIHPNEAVLHARTHEVGPDNLEPRYLPHHDLSLADAISLVAVTAQANPRIRAIGETGMDLFRTGPRGVETQRESFRAHIALAKELDLALQIHDRDAHAEVIDVLLKDGAPERTVFHCFSGDAEMAKIAAENGWYLSFAGPVTYPKNEDLRAALRVTPESHLLAETDAPYLTPHPFRGQPNAPYVTAYTIRAMAEYRGDDLTDLCRALSSNAERVYGAP